MMLTGLFVPLSERKRENSYRFVCSYFELVHSEFFAVVNVVYVRTVNEHGAVPDIAACVIGKRLSVDQYFCSGGAVFWRHYNVHALRAKSKGYAVRSGAFDELFLADPLTTKA